MAPLIVLVVTTLLARLVGALRGGAASRTPPHVRDDGAASRTPSHVRNEGSMQAWAAATRVGLAAMFCFTAAAHFNSLRADLVRMVPPAVPNPEFMVTFTGICEILGAIGLLVPRTRRAAAVGLILLLVSVLPANIHAALSGVTLRGAAPTPLVPRIALQVLFIGLVWWSGIRASRSAAAARR